MTRQATDPTVAAPRRPLLREPEFRKLWVGQTVSQAGSQITMFVLPLLALEVLGAPPAYAVLLSTLTTVPFILIGLPAGALIDRWSTRRVMILTDVARGLLVLLVPVAYFLDALQLWLLLVVALATGFLRVFFDIAYQAFLPSLVDRSRLLAGNAALELSRSGAQIAGPTLAAMVLRVVSVPVVLLIDAVSFFVSALSIMSIRQVDAPAPRRAGERRLHGLGRDITDGLKHVWADQRLRKIAMTTSLANLFSGMSTALFVPFSTVELGLSPATLATVLAVGNVGFLLAVFVAQPMARRLGIGRTLAVGAIVMCAFGVLVPAAAWGLAVTFLIVARIGQGAGSTLYNLGQVSVRQAITPRELQGRMNATMRFLGWGALPVGGMLGVAGVVTIGVTPSTIVAAGGMFLALVPLFHPVLLSISSLDD